VRLQLEYRDVCRKAASSFGTQPFPHTHCRISDVDQNGVVYRAGVEFVEPASWTADAIAQFIEDLKAGRRG
jgi:hypothetical protein